MTRRIGPDSGAVESAALATHRIPSAGSLSPKTYRDATGTVSRRMNSQSQVNNILWRKE
jgi:hypothetical protein